MHPNTIDPTESTAYRDPESGPSMDLLSHVVITAIRDAAGTSCNATEQRDAIRWIRSEDTLWGSFRWYCEILGMDASGVRSALRRQGIL